MKRCFVILLSLVSSLLVAGSATAEVQIQNESYTAPFSETVVSCTGETIELSGTVQHRLIVFYDPRLGYHFNVITRASLTGVSESGVRYVANFVNKGTAYIFLPAEESPEAITFPFSFHLISTDGSQDLVIRELLHLTTDAQFRITSAFDTLYVSCP
jgi:hypothetical protein